MYVFGGESDIEVFFVFVIFVCFLLFWFLIFFECVEVFVM